MKCERCGAVLEENVIRCSYCGHVVQMVPDYNPLEDVVADEVRSAIQLHEFENEILQETTRYTHNDSSTRALKEERGRKPVRNMGAALEHSNEESEKARREREKARRLKIEQKRALKKKQQQLILAGIVGILVLLFVGMYFIYSNSYVGVLAKGKSSLEEENYTQAVTYLKKAISKKDYKIEPYTLLVEAYIQIERYEDAVTILLDTIELDSDNLELYEELISLYLTLDDVYLIRDYMKTLDDGEIKDNLSDYIASEPYFGIESGTYDVVQELQISVFEGTIYYTLDGTEPTKESLVYESGIQLGEGTTTVKAISINDNEIPSYVVEAVYTIDFPVEAAPIVTPSTGQYTEASYITVTVPSGYIAYYTLDNTVPDVNSSIYTEPIEMPEGNTIFTVILINANGKASDVTKRNYNLVIPDPIEVNSDEDELIGIESDEDELEDETLDETENN